MFSGVFVIVKIGIIGGAGLEDPKILKDAKDVEVSTIWGDQSLFGID